MVILERFLLEIATSSDEAVASSIAAVVSCVAAVVSSDADIWNLTSFIDILIRIMVKLHAMTRF